MLGADPERQKNSGYSRHRIKLVIASVKVFKHALVLKHLKAKAQPRLALASQGQSQ